MDHERGAHVAYLPEIGESGRCNLQIGKRGRGCSGELGWGGVSAVTSRAM
jgi:hypothetical protein